MRLCYLLKMIAFSLFLRLVSVPLFFFAGFYFVGTLVPLDLVFEGLSISSFDSFRECLCFSKAFQTELTSLPVIPAEAEEKYSGGW
jgi:hypothetical protein